MTHLGFVAASFGLAVLVPAGFGMLAWQRLTVARRRLTALDPRASR